jgi:hypothetical protein
MKALFAAHVNSKRQRFYYIFPPLCILFPKNGKKQTLRVNKIQSKNKPKKEKLCFPSQKTRKTSAILWLLFIHKLMKKSCLKTFR